MNKLSMWICTAIVGAGCLFAEQLIVQRATLWGPNGSSAGKLVIRGDQMTFIDDNNPDASFIIPKSDVRTARWEGGRLNIDLANPYTGAFGEQRQLVLMMPDQMSAGSVITWVGVPVAGFTINDADRARTPVETVNISDVRFDVRNGDQRGKLLLLNDELAFESLTDSKHSRRWRYSDIRAVTRNGHEVTIRPNQGDKYEFQFKNKAMLETVYNMVSDRVVMARQGR